MLPSTQNILQDQLQRKHEELQQLIVHQQDELRRVSEQLIMARYGLPIVNVTLPFPATATVQSIAGRKMENYSSQHDHQSQSSHDEQIVHLDTHENQHPSDEQQLINTSMQQPTAQPGEEISYMQLTPVSSVHQYSHFLLRDDTAIQMNDPTLSRNLNDMDTLTYKTPEDHEVQVLYGSSKNSSS